MKDEPNITIGERLGWGDPQPFGISARDQRQHIYIIGKTGSGKTTLLHNLLVQHINLGHGVGLIDPHGDLAEDLLHYIPPARADHLCYFNPGDLEFPIGLNLLANVSVDKVNAVVLSRCVAEVDMCLKIGRGTVLWFLADLGRSSPVIRDSCSSAFYMSSNSARLDPLRVLAYCFSRNLRPSSLDWTES